MTVCLVPGKLSRMEVIDASGRDTVSKGTPIAQRSERPGFGVVAQERGLQQDRWHLRAHQDVEHGATDTTIGERGNDFAPARQRGSLKIRRKPQRPFGLTPPVKLGEQRLGSR